MARFTVNSPKFGGHVLQAEENSSLLRALQDAGYHGPAGAGWAARDGRGQGAGPPAVGAVSQMAGMTGMGFSGTVTHAGSHTLGHTQARPHTLGHYG